MDVANIEKGTNNGQAIITLKSGEVLNWLGVAVEFRISQNIIYIDRVGTNTTLVLDFNESSLNKQSQATAQLLVNFYADNDFFLRRNVGSVAGATSVVGMDFERSTISVAGQYAPSKRYLQIFDIQLSNVPIDLNRITYDGTTITFLDGAAIGQTVKVVGSVRGVACSTLQDSAQSPVTTDQTITINSGNLAAWNDQRTEFTHPTNVTINLPAITSVSEGDEMQFVIPSGAGVNTKVLLSPDTGDNINFEGSQVTDADTLDIGRTASGVDAAQLIVSNGEWVVCTFEGTVSITVN